jgi:hypothetical protein
MIRFPNYEKILVALTTCTLLLAGAWARYNAPHLALASARPLIHGVPYLAATGGTAAAESPEWSRPSSQKRGTDWVYEMFTPPEIYYDGRSQEFSVKPPLTADPETEAHPEPVVAPMEPFRLQLVGFVGGEGSYLGTFENVATSEHILARSGRAVPELAVTIRDFQVKRVRREPDDSMPTSELIATAVVRDERTGDDVVLTNLERAYVRP